MNNEVNETNNVQTNVNVEAASTEQPVVNQNVNPTVGAATAQPTVEVENNNKKKKTTQIILAVVASILVIVCAYVIAKSNFINEFFNSNKKENNSGVVEPQGEQQTEKQDEPPVVTPTEDEEEDEEYDEEDEDEEETVEVEKFSDTIEKNIGTFVVKVEVKNSDDNAHAYTQDVYINGKLLNRFNDNCRVASATSCYKDNIIEQLNTASVVSDKENGEKYLYLQTPSENAYLIDKDAKTLKKYYTNYNQKGSGSISICNIDSKNKLDRFDSSVTCGCDFDDIDDDSWCETRLTKPIIQNDFIYYFDAEHIKKSISSFYENVVENPSYSIVEYKDSIENGVVKTIEEKTYKASKNIGFGGYGLKLT